MYMDGQVGDGHFWRNLAREDTKDDSARFISMIMRHFL
jgi:hypothetical protein